jgi:hypothetical protein
VLPGASGGAIPPKMVVRGHEPRNHPGEPMTSLSAPVTPIAPAPESPDGYVPGACNIGPWEVRRRRTGAVLGFAASGLLLAVLVGTGLPAWTRLVLVLPLWGASVSWLQARRRFCVNYAIRGLSNFTDDLGGRRAVVDPVQRELDRRATAMLLRDGLLIAIVPTVVAVLLPV